MRVLAIVLGYLAPDSKRVMQGDVVIEFGSIIERNEAKIYYLLSIALPTLVTYGLLSHLLKNRCILAGVFIALLAFLAQAGVLFQVNLYLQFFLRLPPFQAALYLLPLPVAALAVSVFTSKVLHKMQTISMPFLGARWMWIMIHTSGNE